MTQAIWQGNLAHRSRIISGLVLFVYAFFHFLNVAAGLISPDWIEKVHDVRMLFTGHLFGKTILFGALVTHAALALWQVAVRRTLRMSLSQGVQLALGLALPLQLIQHIVFTTYAEDVFGSDDSMPSIILQLWLGPEVWQQYILLLAVWIHGCIGVHMWLRLTRWWPPLVPTLAGVSVLVPTLALAGLITEGRRMWDFYAVQGFAAEIREDFNWPSATGYDHLYAVSNTGLLLFGLLLGLAILVFIVRRILRRRQSVRITYVDGQTITAERGLSLLEMSQVNGIPHPALCGGKGRCTTCRVSIEAGAEGLPAPSPAEARSLRAVKAGETVRLACQINPTTDLTVKQVYQPKDQRRVHAAQGTEKTIAVLFLDIRGFTARAEDLLPYDVVFLLNRFFDAIVPEITRAGGSVDKYMGDGVLALFEIDSPEVSARASLEAVANIGSALARFNSLLATEGEAPLHIGMGLHMGTVVIGEIGTAGNAPRTLIGSTVNAASRLEAKTKELGVELLISEAVLKAARLSKRELDLQAFELRGVDHPLKALAVQQASKIEALLGSETETAPL